MADRYWVGGTANWDGTAGTKWATTSGGAGGASVPTTADDVFFTNLSTGTCTISTGNTGAKSINCTGFTGTIAGTAAITVSGSVTLVAGMTYTYSGPMTFNGTGTLTSGGKTISGQIVIDGTGITVTLGNALTCNGGITVTRGTFTTSASNYSVTTPGISSSNSNTRTISLNGSTLTLSAAAPILFTTSTNLTFNAGTSQINLSGTSPTLDGGGQTFYDVTFTSTNLASPDITGTNTFRNLTITGRISAGIAFLGIAANQTITGTLTLSAGTSAHYRTFVYSDVIGTARTLTCAAVASLTDIDFRDITIAGAAVSGGNLTGTRLGDCKGNSGITFPAAKTVYWNLSTGGNWGAAGSGSWALTPAGGVTNTAFPLAQDTAVFQAGGPSSGSTVTINANYNIGTIDMSARTSSLITLATGTTTPAIYGNWINGTGTTISGTTGPITFSGRGTQTLTSAGVTFTQGVSVDTVSGSVTLQDAFVSSANFNNALRLISGTLSANGYNVTLLGASTAVNISGTSTRTVNVGSGTWTIAGSGNAWNATSSTNLTVTGTGTISLTSASAKTFAGGNISYTNITLNQGGAGALTITGSNTFGNITNTYASTGATSILFTAGTTTTFGNWSASGTAGNLLTIGSVTAASHTLSKASGTVSADYLSISRSTATGGASWYAGANSTNGGNNSGWIFTAPPAAVTTGNFLFFFN